MSGTTEAHRRFRDTLLALQPGSQDGGLYAAKKGYHSSRAENLTRWPGNYSTRYVQDQRGPSDMSAGTDWTFPDAQAGRYTTIARYASRLLAARDDPRMTGWREFYGQTDSDREVEGWDYLLGNGVSSDSTHLWHIHLSELREQTPSWVNKQAILSVLAGETLDAFTTRVGHPPWSDVQTTLTTDSRGYAVWLVQRACGQPADGLFGPRTLAAVQGLQRSRGLAPDGIVGSATWSALLQEGSTMVDNLMVPDPYNATPDGITHTLAAELRDAYAALTQGEDSVVKRLDRLELMVRDLFGRSSLTLTDAQLATLGTRVSEAVLAHPDTPLGEADRPAIVAAVREAIKAMVAND